MQDRIWTPRRLLSLPSQFCSIPRFQDRLSVSSVVEESTCIGSFIQFRRRYFLGGKPVSAACSSSSDQIRSLSTALACCGSSARGIPRQYPSGRP